MLSALWRDELREEDHTTPFGEPMIPEVTKLNHNGHGVPQDYVLAHK